MEIVTGLALALLSGGMAACLAMVWQARYLDGGECPGSGKDHDLHPILHRPGWSVCWLCGETFERPGTGNTTIIMPRNWRPMHDASDDEGDSCA